MTETIEFTEMEDKNVVFEGARKVYLVGLGTAATTVTFTTDTVKNARTNADGLTAKLLERGEETDKQARENVRQMVSKQKETRQKDIRNAQKRFEKAVSQRMEALLHAMNIPSKNDINSLSNKVTKLNKKVEEMSKTAVQ
jgi:poly(hydroxyalkanoate) granule-associated protein